jgi:hypothetical protein
LELEVFPARIYPVTMSEPAAAPETEAKQSRGLGSYVLWGFVVVMVYFLSGGPIFRLGDLATFKSPKAVYFLSHFYAPWTYLYDNTMLHKPLGMYLHLWRPDLVDKNGDPIYHPDTLILGP